MIYRDKIHTHKHTQNLNNVLNQNVNMTKQVRVAAFAIDIADNLAYCIRINGAQSKYDCLD